jgi:MFS family permease
LLAFQGLFGAVIGLAAAAIFAPLMACVTGWFDTRRSLAVSPVSAGMGKAPLTMSPLAAWLVQGHDWRTTLQIIAAIVAGVMLPSSYTWLFIGAFALGIGSFLSALAFMRLPQRQRPAVMA